VADLSTPTSRDVGGSAYRMISLGTAADEAPVDGRDVLSYRQALDMTIEWEPEEVAIAERKRKALTVRAFTALPLRGADLLRQAASSPPVALAGASARDAAP
jgi:hypothetical protein